MVRQRNSGETRPAVFYLARGEDDDAGDKFSRFAGSYRRHRAGMDHDLFVIFKGFRNAFDLSKGRELLSGIEYSGIYTTDEGFDLGAYFAAASRIENQNVLFLNTSSELVGSDWLLKLAANHAFDDVGMVGCTGSFEAPQHQGVENVLFPNPHIRSNAFLMRRSLFLSMHRGQRFTSKTDAYFLEHGISSFTRQVWASGLKALLVGKDGRGYEPAWWPNSHTFRQGSQCNLLVQDNQTRNFERAPLAEKRFLFSLAWGDGAVLPASAMARITSAGLQDRHAGDQKSHRGPNKPASAPSAQSDLTL